MTEPSNNEEKAFDTGSIIDALGGPRGLLESTIPGVVFATVFAFTNPNYTIALACALGVAVVILIVALVQKRSVQQTISGFIGVALTIFAYKRVKSLVR